MVLAIAGVVTAAALLSVQNRGEREVEQAAERAAALVRLACERAVLGGRDIGFSVVTDGLRFGYFEIDGWRALGEGGHDELRARALGRDLDLQAFHEGVRLELAEEPGPQPGFACLQSGELTPFLLQIGRADADSAWQLEGHLDGRLERRRIARDG